ncbi:hypothetical protein GCM10009624_21570 [Gordonia sinesedis]
MAFLLGVLWLGGVVGGRADRRGRAGESVNPRRSGLFGGLRAPRNTRSDTVSLHIRDRLDSLASGASRVNRDPHTLPSDVTRIALTVNVVTDR